MAGGEAWPAAVRGKHWREQTQGAEHTWERMEGGSGEGNTCKALLERYPRELCLAKT